MSHLGDRLIALIDGELDHDARDRALAHLAGCRQCREEAEAQRQLKSMVAGLDGPEPSTDLVHRLRALAEPGGPVPPAPPSWPTGSGGGSVRAATFDSGRSSRAGFYRFGGRGASLAVAGVFCLATVAATTAFVVGDQGTGAVKVTPPVDRYTVEHAVTVPQVPLTDPAVGSGVIGVSTQPRP